MYNLFIHRICIFDDSLEGLDHLQREHPDTGLHLTTKRWSTHVQGALLYKQAEVLGQNPLLSDFPQLSPNVYVQNEKSCLPCNGSNRLGVSCFIVRLVQH